MNSIASGVSNIQSQQYRYQKISLVKAENPKPQTPVYDIASVTVDVLSVEKTTTYDLENIKPKEVYELAGKLYDEGVITSYDFAIMMFRGALHEYPPNRAGVYLTPNEEPFNLLEELNNMISGKDKRQKPTPAYTINDYSNLFNKLSSIQSISETAHFISIDITV